jgi:hypothetical protein
MKKSRKLTSFIIFTIAILAMVVSVQAAVDTTEFNGVDKTSFKTTEVVYAKSDQGLCNNASGQIDLYIVESGSEDLDDVRGESQEVTLTQNYAIAVNTVIWDEPEEGGYDIVVDCDKDGEIHPLEREITFIVTKEAGTATVSVGKDNPEDHSWRYDPEDLNMENEMLQLTLKAESEDVEMKDMVVSFQGPEEGTDINRLEVYIDQDGDGELDEDDELIGDFEPETPLENDAKATILLDFNLESGEEDLLLVYVMKETTPEGRLSLTVESVSGEGEDSGDAIEFSGLPIDSNTKTVLPEKSCIGELSLELDPSSTTRGERVKVEIRGLEGCKNKRISLRTNPCTAEVADEIGFCLSGETGCQLTVTATESRTYYTCIDKNSDGDMRDFGESANDELKVVGEGELEEEEEEEEEAEEEEEMEEEEEAETGITGAAGALKLGEGLLGAAGGFLILLEITLLLILFVLVMILFKLKGSSSREEEEEEKEKEKEKKK